MTTRTSRPPLSHERIVTAGIELADEIGVDALSMRKLAKHLGFEVMSLYNHVDGKAELLEAMVDHVVGLATTALAEGDQPDDWRDRIRLLARTTYDVTQRHPWSADLWTKVFPGPNRLWLMERILADLDDGGLHGMRGDLAFHAVITHINGFSRQAVDFATDAEAAERSRRFRGVAADALYPRMRAHLDYHAAESSGTDIDEFEFLLDVLLDGIVRAELPAADG
jgi:AcrR family transcriptional regulator